MKTIRVLGVALILSAFFMHYLGETISVGLFTGSAYQSMATARLAAAGAACVGAGLVISATLYSLIDDLIATAIRLMCSLISAAGVWVFITLYQLVAAGLARFEAKK